MNDTDAALLDLGRALKERAYRHVAVTPATHARVLSRPDRIWAARLEDVFGWSLPFQAGLMPDGLWRSMQAAGVVVPEGEGWRSTVRWSTLDADLYVHSAYPTAAADAVFFGPDTYRYTAALRRHLERRTAPLRRAVDIGCGAGPGAVVVAKREPAARVDAVDINADALRFAVVNAALAGIDNVECRRSSLLDGLDGTFDLIAANPPYLLDASERAYRHGGGRLGEGLSLAIADLAHERLAPGGTLLLYTGSAIIGGIDALADALGSRLHADHLDWRYEELDPDVFGEELQEPAYAGADRIAAVLLTAIRRP